MYSFWIGVELTASEQTILEGFFMQRFGATSLEVKDINWLLLFDMKHRTLGGGDVTQAKATFTKMKSKIKAKHIGIVSEMEKIQSDNERASKEINIRSFKLMLQNVFVLSSFEAENLIQYLDTGNEGYITCMDIQKNLQ